MSAEFERWLTVKWHRLSRPDRSQSTATLGRIDRLITLEWHEECEPGCLNSSQISRCATSTACRSSSTRVSSAMNRGNALRIWKISSCSALFLCTCLMRRKKRWSTEIYRSEGRYNLRRCRRSSWMLRCNGVTVLRDRRERICGVAEENGWVPTRPAGSSVVSVRVLLLLWKRRARFNLIGILERSLRSTVISSFLSVEASIRMHIAS